MYGITPVHLVILLAIVLIVIGPGRLPDTGAAFGKAIREFRGGVDGNHGEPSVSVAPAMAPALAVMPSVAIGPASARPDETLIAVEPAVRPGETVRVEVPMAD
ncbi:MAG TPA: twin-arginine translocase TatA/TatE family subunit [Candidatus Saccharimonadales bacterium]|nr:twin-arginine translocase TatA/TatE family subunit [Candidatus Saccharimonadales bacterium]